MSISLIKLHAHPQKETSAKEQGNSAAKPAAHDANAAFEAFLQQLCGVISQAGQQIVSASQQTSSDNTSTAEQCTPFTDQNSFLINAPRQQNLQAGTVPQKDFSHEMAAGKTNDGAPDPAAAFADAFAAQVKEGQTQPAFKKQALERSGAPDGNNRLPTAAEQSLTDLYGLKKTDYRAMVLQQDNGADELLTNKSDTTFLPSHTEPFVRRTEFPDPAQLNTQNGFIMQDSHAASSLHEAGAAASRGAPQVLAKDPAEMFEGATAIIKDGTRLAVKLEPEGLGKLDINVSLEKGMVNAQIHVSDAATKVLIENNMQHIVNSLLNEGLSVSGFSVGMEGHAFRDGAAGDSGNGGSEQHHAASIPVREPARLSAAAGAVNIFV